MGDFINENSSVECDAIPDPPRLPKENLNKQYFNQDQTNAKKSNETFVDPKDSCTSNCTDDKTETENLKFSKPKSKKYSKTKPSAVFNCNIVNSIAKIGNKYVINLDKSQNNKSFNKEEPKEMTPYIQALSNSQAEISKNDMLLVKTHIGKGWNELAKRIGFSEGQIEKFIENNKSKDISEVIYRILINWKQEYTKDATVGNLVQNMWLSKEYDCVERLAAAHIAI